MLAAESMVCHTDDSTLPSSTLDSDTDSCSSQSFPSSIEYLDHSLDVLTHSWPLSKDKTANHLGNQFSSFASWNDLNTVWSHANLRVRPDTSTPWTKLDSRTFGTRTDQTSERRCSLASGTPRKRPSSGTPLTKPDREAPARGCSPDASALYNNSTKHYNPSVSGQHACQEMSGYREWANCYLQYSTHNTPITDLPRDMADGRTLLHLVEELLGVSMDPVHVKPALKVQKIENIQKCLDVLATHCVPVQELSAEDIVEANPKVILVLCKHLKQHFGSTPGSLRGPSDAMTMNRRTRSPKSPVMDPDDVALLDWVGEVTGRAVSDYRSLQDGHILCLLVNKLTDGAVPHVVLEYGLPSEKVSLALMFAEEELGVTCDLNPDDAVNLKDASKMLSFLKTLHRVFLQQEKEKEKERDITMQGINELARKPGELTAKEKEIAIELVRHPEPTPSSFAERITRKKSGKEGSSVPNNAHKMTAQSPSMAKVESKRSERPREKSLSSYLQDGATKMPRDNRLPNHFTRDQYSRLEDLPNTNSSYRNSLTSSPNHPFHSVDISLENSQHQFPSRRKQDVIYCDNDVMHGFAAKESIFDSANWTPVYHMQHAPKSWQKERENAQHQISDFKNELQRLKEEYFRLRNMKMLQTRDKADPFSTAANLSPAKEFVSAEDKGPMDIANSDDITDCSSVDKATMCTVFAGKPVTESGQTSYMNVKKGTLPPYRTWSKYENTDGDRYRYHHTKKETSDTRNITLAAKMTQSLQIAVQNRNGTGSVKISTECRARQIDDANQINSECHDSSQGSTKKAMQEDGLGVVGKHRYGMTALARLSSKKANAV